MNARFHRATRIVAALGAWALASLHAADRAPEAKPTATTESPPATGTPANAKETAPAATKASATTAPVAAKTDGKKNAETKAPDPTAKPAPVLPLTPRFQQVRERINVLYGNREAPPPPIDARHNPFRSQPIASAPTPPASTAASGPAGTGPAPATLPVGEPLPPPANPNIALIKQAAALLRVTGFVERDGRTLLNINQALYREGETVKVAVKGQTVLLRIKKLSRTSLTVTLGEAEHTINF